MNMFHKNVLFVAALCAALAFPAPLLARATMHWYQPHYLPSVDEASNRLQFLSPHFAPVTSDAYENLTTGYSLQRVDVNKLGINLSFTKSGVNQSSQYYWSWWGGYVAPVSTPFNDDIVVSVVYTDVTYFEIYNNERAVGYPATWCVDYIHRRPAGNSTICVPTEADAHALIDALGTLVVASGQSLDVSPAISLKASSDKDFRNHPERAGLQITRMDVDSPPAQAGMREGDVIRTVNGKPCTGEQVFWDVFKQAVREKPEGGVVHVEILRKGNSMTFDLHYPNPDTEVAQLQQKSSGSARHPVGSIIQVPGGSQAAPAPEFHLGIRVRAVTDSDATALGLPKPKGVVVTFVEKGSLGEEMQMQIGDVLLAVNGSEIGDVDFFTQFVHSGAAKSFRVWRKGQMLDLTIPQSM
jgi:membrane-associated protease RseP (regulator of RpoE activity)